MDPQSLCCQGQVGLRSPLRIGCTVLPLCIFARLLSGLVISSSYELVCIFNFFNQRSNLRASYHPPPEGTRVVCKTYRPSITLDASIIVLMYFIDWDCREDPVGLLNSEIASIKLSGNIWVSQLVVQ